jgi:hypothetical protein
MMFSKKWVLAGKKSEIIAGFRHLDQESRPSWLRQHPGQRIARIENTYFDKPAAQKGRERARGRTSD